VRNGQCLSKQSGREYPETCSAKTGLSSMVKRVRAGRVDPFTRKHHSTPGRKEGNDRSGGRDLPKLTTRDAAEGGNVESSTTKDLGYRIKDAS